MSHIKKKAVRVVLYEGDGAEELSGEDRYAAFTSLLSSGYTVSRSASGQALAPHTGDRMVVVGRFSSEATPEFSAGEEADVMVRDLNRVSTEALVPEIDALREETGSAKHGEWKPWFPVIDYDRCTNCMQCLSFCLFGVYGVSEEQQIQVQNNDNCKTNCPACSRVCPEAAIMFPKYKAGPINGEPVSASDMNREKMKVDISSLLGGDVYSMLRDRSAKAKSRFSKERDSDKALNERQKCLVKLANSADIPAEVLMSLPSPDEIQRRAAEAQAKADAARAAAEAKK